ncbi:MAG TPA: response regulator [Phenylobacterium sp.]|jgi:DNA-binding NtrC family response regulator|nr:response regulator [Phenylobacterium sp.]
MHSNRILLAEDNVILSHALCEFMRAEGYDVKTVYCGKAGFEAINRGEYFSALVTDIDLGPGPDGVDLARYARAHLPHLPIVFMSGIMDPRYAVNGIARSQFVAKPCEPRQISQALTTAIRLEAA